MDTLTPEERSQRMALVKNKGTKPEVRVRKALTKLGFRYRLHYGKLPGRPDIVFPSKKKAIFVHGCFWHRHLGCPSTRLPKSRLDFWEPKLEGNRRRDIEKQRQLGDLGWDYLVVWECETRDENKLADKLNDFLRDRYAFN